MNEPTPYVPPSAPSVPPPDPSRGSLLVGFLLGWAVLVGGYVVFGFLVAILAQLGGSGVDGVMSAVYVLGGSLPWVAIIGLIVWFAAKNKPRSALGVALAIVSMVGLALLLVAACFGLLAASDGWH